MATFTRRKLFTMAAATAAGAMLPRSARGWFSGSGDYHPDGGWGLYGNPRRVLEIFMRGGASFWGSFWRDNNLGADGTGTGDVDVSPAEWGTITGGAVPSNNIIWQGQPMGQACAPLFQYASKGNVLRRLSDRMRIIRMGHDLKPHELAIPYAITGTPLGRPSMFGLGALIWWNKARTSPFTPNIRSIILRTKAEGYDLQAAGYAATTGSFGDQYRPPVIPMGDESFSNALLRTGQTDTDALKAFYQSRYRELLRPPQAYADPLAQTVPSRAFTRSAGFSSYDVAMTQLRTRCQEISTLTAGHDFFTRIDHPDYNTSNYTRVAINGAIDLLASGRLDHVAVIDGGVENDYDTHHPPSTEVFAGLADQTHTTRCVQAGNIWNVCSALMLRTNDILDQGITVLINSEFGRLQESDNSDHHGAGYVNVVLSDLITSPAFRGIVVGDDLSEAGGMCAAWPGNPTQAHAFNPTDVYAAMAQVAGIDPWQSGLYDGNLSCVGYGSDAAAVLLGI